MPKWLKAIGKFLADLFAGLPNDKTTEVPIEPVVNQPSQPPVNNGIPKMLTREEWVNLDYNIFMGRIKVSPYNDEYDYFKLREKTGKNDHLGIYALTERQGGERYQAYCQYGQQDKLDAKAKHLNIPRKLFAYPEGGGTQRVFNKVDKKYIRTVAQGPLIGCFATVVYNGTGVDGESGHIEDIFKVIGYVQKGAEIIWNVQTLAFNTNIDGDDSIVRDGAGAGIATRALAPRWKQKNDTVTLRGYVDHYLIYVDAYKKHYKLD